MQRTEKRLSVLSILANDPEPLPDNEEGEAFYLDPVEHPASYFDAMEAEEARRPDYDPTLWCNACGARHRVECSCGPIAEND